MAFELKGRKVAGFRTHIDPMIGPKPKNSFDKREMTNAEFELTPIGVYVRVVTHVPGGQHKLMEHIVPYANVQSIRLEALPEPEKKD